jgi:quercetin dioxygenase-like cupin family protein
MTRTAPQAGKRVVESNVAVSEAELAELRRRVNLKRKVNYVQTILALMIVVSTLSLFVTQAQQSGIKRTDLQQHDLGIPGREVIQVRVDIAPGVVAPNHSHPGEEIIYVIEGELEYYVEGKSPVTLKAGEVLFIPHGTKHSARNVGNVNGAELATYIVEKGKPLVVPAK